MPAFGNRLSEFKLPHLGAKATGGDIRQPAHFQGFGLEHLIARAKCGYHCGEQQVLCQIAKANFLGHQIFC